jgi:tRNA-dihydrouridine synthase B
MRIGNFRLDGNLILAPMAGVTDRPFRQLCRRYGAALAVSEMVSAKPELQAGRKTLLRCDHQGEAGPRSVQILGAEPRHMAEAAKLNVGRGADIIDINMGCPAKKVCNVAAGSALLRDEALVGRILEAVVRAVDAPVTLKIRTGWDLHNRNAVGVAKIAESSGIAALAVHGRSRACGFSGLAEYSTIAEVKAAVGIPVIANGDIDSAAKARLVLDQTGADALMIGRAALGKPWLFAQIRDGLDAKPAQAEPGRQEIQALLTEHLSALYAFYGEYAGLRIARKHIVWYSKSFGLDNPEILRPILAADSAEQQMRLIFQPLTRPQGTVTNPFKVS